MSRFDRAVAMLLGGLALWTLVVAWRGVRIDATIVAITPADGATDVSSSVTVRAQLQDAVVPGDLASLAFDPPQPGTLLFDGADITFTPAVPLAPGTAYTVTLKPGIRTFDGRTLHQERRWSFRTGATAVVFLRRDASEHDQLMTVSATGGDPRALTDAPRGIWDYAVAVDGSRIAYAMLREDGGSDIMTIDRLGGDPRLLLACVNAQCEGMAFAPDGRTMVFEKRTLTPDGLAGPPKLWWLDTATGDSVAVFDDSQHLGFDARFSPDGKRLAYTSPDDGSVRIFTMDTGKEVSAESQMGEPASWRPDGRALALTDLVGQGQNFFAHSFRLDLGPDGAPAKPIDISGGDKFEDSQPVWSPDGKRLALARRLRTSDVTALGRGIWLMDPDGRNAVAITSGPTAHDSAPQWSPDGHTILCERVDTAQIGAEPSVWTFNVVTGAALEVAGDGYRAAWLP